jgi:hypothetical protein
VKVLYRKEPSLPGAAHKDRTSVLRPRIRVRLFHKNRFIDLLALVAYSDDVKMITDTMVSKADLANTLADDLNGTCRLPARPRCFREKLQRTRLRRTCRHLNTLLTALTV